LHDVDEANADENSGGGEDGGEEEGGESDAAESAEVTDVDDGQIERGHDEWQDDHLHESQEESADGFSEAGGELEEGRFLSGGAFEGVDDKSQQDSGGEPDEDAEVAGSGAGFRGGSIHAANFRIGPVGD